ncbi:O-methyltransferase [Flavobacterium sp. 7A]|uniref:O-methyltransferase n=1 Tax=Flavobacterium sp. 7A TaxID=2940571 RepID=UPI002227B730|nr:class I SAM-dependent methyltransferase [Flavobacterium sp. 7A]MCW2119856.1 putative O-methyltransferase YrrM [Flavobacterium sp. 7A]
MLFQIKSYLQFFWYSKNEHAVHSPFVFTLITKCFYDTKTKSDYTTLKQFRKKLLDNTKSIEIVDFGAGSKVFQSNHRIIAQIAKTAGIKSKRAELLYRISSYFEPKNILELGTSLGLATSALAIGNPKATITTLEGCSQTAAQAQLQFTKFGLKNIQTVVGEFEASFEKLSIEKETFDLIYFDGNHSKKATLAYFEQLLSTITNDTVWIFDDIHWSKEMEEAWNTIKQHSKVTATIDTFQWGLVFFRREQPKEHFIIRT